MAGLPDGVVPPDGVGLRPAAPADVGALTSLAERAFAVYVDRIGQRPVPMDADHGRHVDEHEVWIAEVDQGAAGFVVLVQRVDSLEVDTVAVDPIRQGHGIGRCLLDLAEARAAATGTTG